MIARNMLSQVAAPVAMLPSSTSYFSTPSDRLDPVLFESAHLKPAVRSWILATVHRGMSSDLSYESLPSLMHSETWARVWVAGSGVSYQWEADRDPADLDILLGIDYVEFRRANPAFVSFTDSEIASMMNERFRDYLSGPHGEFPFSDAFQYEVTVYVNRGVSAARDAILTINPYAAYDVTQDEWALVPQPQSAHVNPAWEMSVERDRRYAEDLVSEYGNALNQVRNATNPAHRTNAESRLSQLMDAAAGLYDELHDARKAAFTTAGAGYADFNNYRWQAGKASGVVQATKRIKQYLDDARDQNYAETYGIELPDTRTLIRRSALQRLAP